MTAPAYATRFRFHAGPAAALGVGVAMSWIFALFGLPVPTNCGRRLGTAAEALALVAGAGGWRETPCRVGEARSVDLALQDGELVA
jgi:hypothetical protein